MLLTWLVLASILFDFVMLCSKVCVPVLAVWLAAQTPHSKGAKADVLQAKYSLACAQYLPPTPIADAYAAL
jgi:hypothetical protein